MYRMFCIAVTCMSLLSCFCTNAEAIEVSDAVSGEYEITDTLITRATGAFNMSVEAHGRTAADKEFPLATGETVRIRASYAPEDASMDFGLVDSEGIFHYVNVTTGSIDKTIEVPENGNYVFAIRNNSESTVKVSGFVTY